MARVSQGAREATHLNQVIQWSEGGLSWEADPKHLRHLKAEYGMQRCGPAGPHSDHQGGSGALAGVLLLWLAVLRIGQTSPWRSKSFSQFMSCSTQGIVMGVKLIIRHLQK